MGRVAYRVSECIKFPAMKSRPMGWDYEGDTIGYALGNHVTKIGEVVLP
jgi:hypothetical protein